MLTKKQQYYQNNKEKIKEQVTKNRNSKPDHYKPYMRWYSIKKKYNLTQEQYEAMELKQDHKCAICKIKACVVVDHNHETKIVRGLLCNGCNRDLAILDNPDLLSAAKEYKNASEKLN